MGHTLCVTLQLSCLCILSAKPSQSLFTTVKALVGFPDTLSPTCAQISFTSVMDGMQGGLPAPSESTTAHDTVERCRRVSSPE